MLLAARSLRRIFVALLLTTPALAQAPNANNDTANVCPGSFLDVNVLANDSSIFPLDCGATAIVVPPTAGSAVVITGSCANTLCSGQCIRYSAPASFSGPVTFTYRIQNGFGSDTAVVTINVRTPPVLNNDTASLCQGAQITICPFANDSSDTPIVCPAPGSTTGLTGIPAGWVVQWMTAAACGAGPANMCPNLGLRIVPPAAFTGTVGTITYTLIDTDNCADSATVTVNVRTPPVLNNDTASLCQGAEVTLCPFANDASDTPLVCPAPGSTTGLSGVPAGWTVTWVTTGVCGAGPANTCPNLGLRIVPPTAFTGTVNTISYTLSDADTCSDSATVTINVRTPPVLVNDMASTCLGTPVVLCVFANDTSDTPLVCPAPGSSTGIAGIPAGWVAQWVTSALCGASPPNTCPNLGLRVQPPPGFTGIVSTISYTLSDTDTCADSATVTVIVCAVNAIDDVGTFCPGTVTDFDVLANDTTSCGALDCTTMQLLAPVPPGFSLVGCGGGPCGTCRIRYVAPAAPPAGPVSVGYRIGGASTTACTDTATLTLTPGELAVSCGLGTVTTTQTFSDCHGCPLGSTFSSWSTPGVPRLQIPKVALGPGQELVQVRADLHLRHAATVRVENRAPTSCLLQVNFDALASACPTVTIPGGCSSVLCVTQPVAQVQAVPLAAFDGVVDFSGPSGTVLPLSATDSSSAVFSSPAALAHFTDTNPSDGFTEFVEFDHAVSNSTSASGCAPMTMQSDPFASIEVVVVYTVCTIGVPYCPGDGTGTACPCGNTSPVGAGRGCRNSSGLGGELRAEGEASLSADTLRLVARSLTGATALFVQADTQDSGGLGTMLGDGLRCINGSIIRLLTNPASGGSAFYPMPGNLAISVRGAVTVPGARYYQVNYRNAAAFCTPDTFNLTNGLWIQWIP